MGLLALESDFQKRTSTNVISVDKAYNEFMEYTHYRTDGVLVRRYFDLSANTIGWLQDMGVEFEEAARYFPKSYPSWHIVKSDDGVRGGGQAATMTRRMKEKADKLGVKFYLETAGTEILLSGGKIAGAKALANDNSKIYEVTAKAVQISTGGFGNNAEMVYKELGYTFNKDYDGMRLPHHEGDGLRMAQAAGAGYSEVNIEMIFQIARPGSRGRAGVAGSIMQQPNLLVNVHGQRFFNEEQVQNTTYCGNALVQQTGNTGFMIIDETIKEDYVKNGVPFVSRVSSIRDFSSFDEELTNVLKNSYTAIQKANTLDELAALMGINAQGLKQTVEEYNVICTARRDPMGKSTEFLRPIRNGPFYAAQYLPSSYGTLGGIPINSDLEVLANDGSVIPGLYSSGTDACKIFGDSYMFLLPGNTMGFSVNSGRMAGANAAAYALGN
jgi:fumarate reductase flavoprotein subunit